MVRVVLVDEGWSSTLHLARALVSAGAEVEVITANGKAHEPFLRRGVRWRSGPRLENPRLRDLLHGDVVIPMTEAAILADLPNAFPKLEPWQRALVANKHAMTAHAGVATPNAIVIDEAFDIDAAIARLGLPLVLRGPAGNCGSQTIICETRDHVTPRLGWIAQRYVASPTFLVGALLDRGRPLRVYAGEKVEQWPPRTGPAVHMRALRDPALIAAGLQAFERLQWTGFASADFVYANGEYQLLEVNPRLWGSIYSTITAGVDMFPSFYKLIRGVYVEPMLEFVADAECRIFPRNLAAHPARGLWELLGKQGRGWRSPRFLKYLLSRQPT
ncbi:MAG: hypothetical protein QM831_03655 [Kofleriaceae bacterium]